MSDQHYARTDGTKDPVIRELYLKANKEGVCAFDDLDPAINRPVYPEDGFTHWNVWFHPRPQKGTSAHIMIASKRHLRYPGQLPLEADREFREILEALTRDFSSCYSLVSRMGGTPEANYNATTVYHLHWHFVVSNAKLVDGTEAPLRFQKLYIELKALAADLDPGADPLEFLDDLREWIDVLRAFEKGTAWPIRFKLSNAAEPD